VTPAPDWSSRIENSAVSALHWLSCIRYIKGSRKFDLPPISPNVETARGSRRRASRCRLSYEKVWKGRRGHELRQGSILRSEEGKCRLSESIHRLKANDDEECLLL
jgi:hypothetical protein